MPVTPEAPRSTPWPAGLLVAAGILHLVALPGHLAEARGMGIYFLLVGTAQVVWGFGFLTRPSNPLARIGIVFLTLAPAVLWVMTRTLRSPWGTGPEAADLTSLATVALEILAAVLLARWHTQASAAPRGEQWRTLRVLAAAGLVAGALAYGGGMAAEAGIPWLAEPEASHHGHEEPTPSADTTQHGNETVPHPHV